MPMFYEGIEVMHIYRSTHYKPSHLMAVGGQVHSLSDLIPGER
jgi:hypothetical protein